MLVVHHTTNYLLVWAQKTLEFASFDVIILSNTHRTRIELACMEKNLDTNGPSNYKEAKGKI